MRRKPRIRYFFAGNCWGSVFWVALSALTRDLEHISNQDDRLTGFRGGRA